MPAKGQMQDLSWLVTDFTERVPAVAHAVVVSSGGMPLAASESMAADGRDQLAAITFGLVRLGAGAARLFGGGALTRTLMTMDRGHLVIVMIGDGSSLAALAGTEADLDLIAFEMDRLAEQAGGLLALGARGEQR